MIHSFRFRNGTASLKRICSKERFVQWSSSLTDVFSWYFINYSLQKKMNNDLGFRRPTLFLELNKWSLWNVVWHRFPSWSTDCLSNPLLIWKPLEGNCCTCPSGHGDRKVIKAMSFGKKGGKNAWSPNCHIIFEARLSLHLPRSSCWH